MVLELLNTAIESVVDLTVKQNLPRTRQNCQRLCGGGSFTVFFSGSIGSQFYPSATTSRVDSSSNSVIIYTYIKSQFLMPTALLEVKFSH